MKLRVDINGWGEDFPTKPIYITNPDQIAEVEKIVARAVRHFLRNVPLTRNGARTTIDLRGCYTERGGTSE